MLINCVTKISNSQYVDNGAIGGSGLRTCIIYETLSFVSTDIKKNTETFFGINLFSDVLVCFLLA